MKHGQKRRGWVWLAIIAVAVASAPSAESTGSSRNYSPILNLLAARADNWPANHAAATVLHARPASSSAAVDRTRVAPGLFRAMLAEQFVGLVSPLTPVSACILLELHRPPSRIALSPLFQRPPPSQL